jgi:hypothetical protein
MPLRLCVCQIVSYRGKAGIIGIRVIVNCLVGCVCVCVGVCVCVCVGVCVCVWVCVCEWVGVVGWRDMYSTSQ